MLLYSCATSKCPSRVKCKRAYCVSVFAKLCTPPKRKTGGGGNGGWGGNGNNSGGSGGNQSDDDNNAEERARIYNIGVLQRAFKHTSAVTPKALHTAMITRWGRPYRCELISDNNILSIKVQTEPHHIHDEDDDIYLISEILNSYNLGPQFIDYIKYDHSLRDPRYQQEIIIPLNIPLTGHRTSEWTQNKK